jgi:hypothetical protein
MKVYQFSILALMVACNNGTEKETYTVPEVAIFTDSTASEAGTRDSILTSERFSQMIVSKFDRDISVENLLMIASGQSISDELVARDEFRQIRMKGDTIVPLPKPPANAAFSEVASDKLRKAFESMYVQKAVYNNNTYNISEIQDSAVKTNAEKVFCIIDKHKLSLRGRKKIIRYECNPANTVKSLESICESQTNWKFCLEQCLSNCTGFAISDSLIVTAGHCVSQYALNNICFVYGYKATGKDYFEFDTTDIYQGVEVVDYVQANEIDYAVVKVNKKIPKFRIVNYSTKPLADQNAEYYMLGYPLGVPLKVSFGGKVVSNNNPHYFLLSIDSFGGNSGSPVLNYNTNAVEGILFKGTVDFLEDEKKGCRYFTVCDIKI